jgi:hypothetical protein
MPFWFIICGVFVVSIGLTFMAKGLSGMIAENLKKKLELK